MTITQRILAGAMLASIVWTSGCASILSKTTYPVTIDSVPSEADFAVRDRKGEVVATGVTPQKVLLPAKRGFFLPGQYHVSFEKPGYEPQSVLLKSSLDEWYFGNIILGGAVGMLVVDPATGAMWELPKNVSTQLAALPTESDGPIQQASYAEQSEPPVELH